MKTKGLSHDTIISALEALMGEISEANYCAGWMSDLEFNLYGIVVGDRFSSYGMGAVTDSEVRRLKELSEACDGWVTGDGFIKLVDWLKLYAPHRDEYKAKNWWPCSTGWCIKHHPEEKDKPHILGVNMECGH